MTQDMNDKELIRVMHAKAQGLCGKFTGQEDLQQVCGLLFSPQGREYCMNNDFPAMDIWRGFKQLGVNKHGIYVDAGNIDIAQQRNIALVGNTHGRLTAKGRGLTFILLLHGATVEVEANDYVIVSIEGNNADKACTHKASGKARVFVYTNKKNK